MTKSSRPQASWLAWNYLKLQPLLVSRFGQMTPTYPPNASQVMSEMTLNFCSSNISSMYVRNEIKFLSTNSDIYICSKWHSKLLPPNALHMSGMTLNYCKSNSLLTSPKWLQTPESCNAAEHFAVTQDGNCHKPLNCLVISSLNLRQTGKLSRDYKNWPLKSR